MEIALLYLKLFVTFFEIGLFGFGGGYGMLSLIQTKVVPDWMSTSQFTDIVAISQMTPGPIGINSATYCGYMACHNAGMSTGMSVLGSCIATFVGTKIYQVNPIKMIVMSAFAGLLLLY